MKEFKDFNSFDELLEIIPTTIKHKLEELKSMRERPDFHPEDSVFEHIGIVFNRLLLTKDNDLIASALFHDIAKLDTMRINPKTGHPTSPGHDKKGVEILMENKEWVENLGGNIKNISEICGQHMRIKQMSNMRPHKQEAIRNLENFDKLEIFTKADNMLEEFKL